MEPPDGHHSTAEPREDYLKKAEEYLASAGDNLIADRAAMIYQHATRERDQAIAAALDALIDAARGEERGDAVA